MIASPIVEAENRYSGTLSRTGSGPQESTTASTTTKANQITPNSATGMPMTLP